MNTKDGMKENNFEVIRPGINTTYQDFGRKNLYHIGVPFSGAMDNRNYLISNKLVNNKINSAVIEFAYQGPMLKFNGESTTFAITGDVNFNIKRKKNLILEKGNSYQTYNLKSGDEIDILSTNRSVYGYLAIAGNIDVKFFGNSCSTNTKAKIGSNDGEKIKKGDKIFFSNLSNITQIKKLNYINTKIEQIRVIRGTNYDYFSKSSQNKFFKESFKITKLSDRMGMRLEGPKIENIVDPNIKSEGLVKGVIQITSAGDPIIMLSDHGTIGGYPKIATVISADYDRLVQLTPGSNIKFKDVSLEDAETLYKLYQMETNNLISQIK